MVNLTEPEVEVAFTEKQALVLMHSLKTAELAYSNQGKYQAAHHVSKLHEYVHRQLFTYGQMDEEEYEEEYD